MYLHFLILFPWIYFFAFPIKDLTAETVKNAIIQNIVMRYEGKESIKTDNYSTFKNEYILIQM